jgi:hypothetical protein
MKGKFILLGSMLLSVLFFVSLLAKTTVNSSNDLVISINQLKSNYSLGEIVALNLEIKNQSNKDIYLFGATVDSGYVKILVSDDGKNYKEYSGANWGNKKSKGKTIKAAESIISDAKILSNSVPDTSNLSDVAVRGFADKQLMTVYAFSKAGDYFVKAVLIIPNKGGNTRIESEPLKVRIAEPEGDDLEVWNKIKDRADFAYFIQEGEFVDFRNLDEKLKFQQEIDEIVYQYPNSLLGNQVKQSLDKFTSSEEKRKVSMETQKEQKKPQ